MVRSLHLTHRCSGSIADTLIGIATNLIAAERRGRAKEASALGRAGGRRLLEPDDYVRLEEQIDAAQRCRELDPALNRLSAVEREMLMLVGEHGLTPGEAATMLGIGAVAARMRLARARRRVKQAAKDTTRAAPSRPVLRQEAPRP